MSLLNQKLLPSIQDDFHQKILYTWEGLDAAGHALNGKIYAASRPIAQASLIQEGIQLRRIRPAQTHVLSLKTGTFLSTIFLKKHRRLAQTDFMLLYRHLAILLRAGLSLTQSLKILERTQIKPTLCQLIKTLHQQIEEGITFKESMEKHPQHFSTFYCGLIHVGERTGQLPEVLEQIANHQEIQEKQRQDLKKALRYPVTVLIMAVLISCALLAFVFPKFIPFFKAVDADLPYFTQCLLDLSQHFGTYGLILSLVIGGSLYGGNWAYKNNRDYRRWFDRIILHIPFVGAFLNKVLTARFTRTLATSLEAGLPLLEGMEIARGVLHNHYYISGILLLEKSIAAGQSLETAIKSTQLFSPMVDQMLTIGEESSMLPQMLYHIASYYESEVKQRVFAFNTLLEPMLMILLGLLMGSLILALYLPIFKLSTLF